jgi:hypothetical protein
LSTHSDMMVTGREKKERNELAELVHCESE